MYLRDRSSGFTLIELVVTLAVSAILIMLVVPSFQRIIEDNRVTSETNTLIQALQMARSEAVNRFASVTVTAVGGDFADGWCVHTAANCAGNNIIRQYDSREATYVSTAPSVIFDNRGDANPQVLVRVAPQDCPTGADRVRRITVGLSGQIRLGRENCP